MGYESLEKDSLITLHYALYSALKKKSNIQIKKDMNYELQRIENVLNILNGG